MPRELRTPQRTLKRFPRTQFGSGPGSQLDRPPRLVGLGGLPLRRTAWRWGRVSRRPQRNPVKHPQHDLDGAVTKPRRGNPSVAPRPDFQDFVAKLVKPWNLIREALT